MGLFWFWVLRVVDGEVGWYGVGWGFRFLWFFFLQLLVILQHHGQCFGWVDSYRQCR